MAQVQPQATTIHGMRPTTPTQRTPLNIPRLSPSRIPDQLLTSASVRNGHINLDTFSPVNQNGSFEFDRVIKSGKVLRRVKKKGAWKPSWKPAYLVLRPNLLSVYKNADETELKTSITLSDVTAVARVKKTHTDNVFGVFTPAKNHHFAGYDARQTSDWVTLLRMESRIEGEEELELPPPNAPTTQRDHAGSESTDLSADDEVEPPGSPEVPNWSVRGNKGRSGSTSNTRKPSHLRDYSGNEAFTTSQSDLSDTVPPGAPYQALSSSIPKSKTHLETIPDGNTLVTSQSNFPRSTSQLSITQIQPPLQQQIITTDPNKVIRQSNILLLKSVPGTGVRQWKSIWMVLRPSSLALYKSNNEYEPLKIVQVSDLIDAAEIDPVSKSKRYCLQIIGLEKTWRFCVESERELEEWLGALKSVLSRRGRERGQSTGQVQIPKHLQGGQSFTYNQNPHTTISSGSMYQGQSTISQASTTQGSTLQPANKNSTIQHQRSEGVLDGIVEGTEQMVTRR